MGSDLSEEEPQPIEDAGAREEGAEGSNWTDEIYVCNVCCEWRRCDAMRCYVIMPRYDMLCMYAMYTCMYAMYVWMSCLYVCSV